LTEARPPVPWPPVPELPEAVKPGSWLSASCRLTLPLALIASLLTETIGLTAVLLGRWISEPVTTISLTSGWAGSAAGGLSAWALLAPMPGL
jgi:hypothetical protein